MSESTKRKGPTQAEIEDGLAEANASMLAQLYRAKRIFGTPRTDDERKMVAVIATGIEHAKAALQ